MRGRVRATAKQLSNAAGMAFSCRVIRGLDPRIQRPRVPDAVRHSSCRSAEPGPVKQASWTPGSAAHRCASATRCAASGERTTRHAAKQNRPLAFASGRRCRRQVKGALAPEATSASSALRLGIVRRRRTRAVLRHELVELFLVLGVAQAVEEVAEFDLLFLEPAQRVGAVFVEGAVAARSAGRTESRGAPCGRASAPSCPASAPSCFRNGPSESSNPFFCSRLCRREVRGRSATRR